MKKRIMIDEKKCDGCRNCEVACMQAHRSDQGSIYDLDLTDGRNESRNHIVELTDGSYRPIFCRHCDQPECVMSCMSGALVKDPETGLVLYDEKKCGSCFMCVMNCPYGVLKPDRMTHTKILKCDFCQEQGGEPSCVKACPKQALYLLDEAAAENLEAGNANAGNANAGNANAGAGNTSAGNAETGKADIQENDTVSSKKEGLS